MEKKRLVSSWSDDGVDYMGHGRGSSRSGSDDRGCDCPLGALEHTPVEIRPMCLNCGHQEAEYCTCEQVLKTISTMFDVGGRVGIKDMTAVCEQHTLDLNVLSKVLVCDTKKNPNKTTAGRIW